jgi:hypothetical protein
MVNVEKKKHSLEEQDIKIGFPQFDSAPSIENDTNSEEEETQ